jgi:hypothetical protein
MRAILVVLLLTTGCSSMKEGFQKGFDRSFLEKCLTSAKEKGATEVRAKAYCECALKKVHDGQSIDNAAAACQ